MLYTNINLGVPPTCKPPTYIASGALPVAVLNLPMLTTVSSLRHISLRIIPNNTGSGIIPNHEKLNIQSQIVFNLVILLRVTVHQLSIYLNSWPSLSLPYFFDMVSVLGLLVLCGLLTFSRHPLCILCKHKRLVHQTIYAGLQQATVGATSLPARTFLPRGPLFLSGCFRLSSIPYS